MKGEEMTGRVGRMDGMGDLAEFLLACFAEDEAAASLEVGRRDVILTGAFAPAFILAECDAKRRIVELHALARTMGHQCVAIDGPTQHHMADPCATLRLLALPYADHDGFREEWRA